jgi:FkbM family methyltransferase
MLGQLRRILREAVPPRLLHAYRVFRHTRLWPCEEEMLVARQFLDADKIAVDVGANVGLFTSVLARHAKKVISFEPNPACARHLARVAPANCEVVAKAVSNKAGETVLRVPVDQSVAMEALGTIEAANHFETETRANDFITHPVETVTLDEALLERLVVDDRIAFINIDAEGHEFAVLKGAERIIAKERPVFLVELEYRHGAPVEAIFAWMQERSYAPKALITGRDLEPINPTVLRELQDETRLALRLAGNRRSGYVNNIFFLPQP